MIQCMCGLLRKLGLSFRHVGPGHGKSDEAGEQVPLPTEATSPAWKRTFPTIWRLIHQPRESAKPFVPVRTSDW